MPGFLTRLQSLFSPVRVRKASSEHNSFMELLLFRGRYMLATEDAIYSDGEKYRPLLAAFSSPALQPTLEAVRSVLVLGTGLASAVHILEGRGIRPAFTLVEIDKVILDWAVEFLPPGAKQRVEAVHSDAFVFVHSARQRYDLIIVDIFFGRSVPAAVTGSEFLQRCRDLLNPGAALILNYMVAADNDPQKAKAALEATFTEVVELSFGLNKVYLAFVTA